MKPLFALIAMMASGAAQLAMCANATAPPTPLAQLRTALEAADAGRLDPAQHRALQSHPVWPWIEYAALLHDLPQVSGMRAHDFLQRQQQSPVAELFFNQWLEELARRKDWAALLADWQPRQDTALRCNHLQARQATGALDAQWTADAQAIWLSSGKSLPDACDPVFATLTTTGALTPTLRWQRIDLAIAAGEPGVIRSIATGLPPGEGTLANDYAAFLTAPHARALQWPKDARSRSAALAGLTRLARRDAAAAEAQAPPYINALGLSAEELGTLTYTIALYSAGSYLPDSARRLAAVPDALVDDNLREWRVREALARSDWATALTAVRAMTPAQRADSRWRYFEARLAELTGDKTTAQNLYAQAASNVSFHGYLAADRIGQPYPLCPIQPASDRQARNAVAAAPAMIRAMTLWQLNRSTWAAREWTLALQNFDDAQRLLAVEIANDHGWFDRAVFALGNVGGQNHPEELRFYELRFPLAHETAIKRDARRQKLDPAWVAAHIRAESVFDPHARSPANARGLMQVLPTTGAAVAKRIGMPWKGADTLFDADANIAIGSAYLRQMLDRYPAPYMAIAAYNAGPTPVAGWQSQRSNLDADFWIETIGYRETRDYVARVLIFSALYDWRLQGQALPLSERLLGRFNAQRKAFVCNE